MLKKTDIQTHRVVRLLRGSITYKQQTPTPGLNNSKWEYFDIFVELDNGIVVSLTQGSEKSLDLRTSDGLVELDQAAVPDGVKGATVTDVFVPENLYEVWLELDSSSILQYVCDWYGSGVMLASKADKVMPKKFLSPWEHRD